MILRIGLILYHFKPLTLTFPRDITYKKKKTRNSPVLLILRHFKFTSVAENSSYRELRSGIEYGTKEIPLDQCYCTARPQIIQEA